MNINLVELKQKISRRIEEIEAERGRLKEQIQVVEQAAKIAETFESAPPSIQTNEQASIQTNEQADSERNPWEQREVG